MKTFEIVVKTLFGFENILAEELKELGAENIKILTRAVSFTGNKELLYKCNLYLRTAIKVLKPIASFKISNEKELYNKVKTINWEKYISYKNTFAIDGTTNGEVFTHSKYVALKSKDAIADLFREKYGIRPSIDTINPNLRINIHISDTDCNISLDSSGTPLGKRDYKQLQTTAPINEILAAGMILMSGWDKKRDFIDPMCGSGTIPIEAAMIACNIAPGKLRNFAFEKWKDFDSELWKQIKTESELKITPTKARIIASDIDVDAVEITENNAKRINVNEFIEIEKQDFINSEAKIDNGILLFNPPYGERLAQEEIIPLYKEIGTKLKHSYNGCDAWIISGNLEALKFIGLKPSKKIKLFNGPIECKFNKFELYRGSKKQKK